MCHKVWLRNTKKYEITKITYLIAYSYFRKISYFVAPSLSMLNNYLTKVKSFYLDNKSDLYIAAIIFLVGMASFGLGRLSVLWPKKEPITITNGQLPVTDNSISKKASGEEASVSAAVEGKYVASKSGAAYHYPWCQGALKIKEANKIWFQTKEEAEKAGYKPAGNCEGL